MTGPEAARRLTSSATLRGLAVVVRSGQIFLTGGSLRDRILGIPTHDVDLSVTGDPREAAEAIAAAVGGRCFPLGRAPLVTWRVASGRTQVDVWGVNGSIEDDICRRDFTINALFWRLPLGPLLDLVGGLDDLAAGRIRVVRPENLLDDPLRVLRGVRLLSTHPQLRLNAETEALVRGSAGRLRAVARERVRDELRLLLAGSAVRRALSAANRLGVLPTLFPDWDGYPHAAAAAGMAGALQEIRQSSRGAMARGARDVAAAVLAAPAAGFPVAWNAEPACEALAAAGWPLRAARRAVTAVVLGERLRTAFGRADAAAKELAVEAGDLLEPAAAWTAARARLDGGDLAGPASAILRWQRRFDGRRPLLSGDEVADLLDLAPGEARAEAVAALRRARARGDARNRAQARRFLLERSVR